MLNKVKATFLRTASKIKLETVKNAPTILLVSGVGFGIGALYFAMKRSDRVKSTLYIHNEDLDTIHAQEDIPEEVRNKMVVKRYTATAVEIGKIVAPVIACELVSIGCIISSHNILNARYVGAVGLYETTKAAFDKYRQRVIEDSGEAKDQEYMFGKGTDIIETDEQGNTNKYTEYAREDMINDGNTFWFDETSGIFMKDPYMNRRLLDTKLLHLNDKLRLQGFITRYDIKKELDMYRTGTFSSVDLAMDMQIGKIYDPKKSDIENDLDFGLDLPVNEAANLQKTNVYTVVLNTRDNVLKHLSEHNHQVDVAY